MCGSAHGGKSSTARSTTAGSSGSAQSGLETSSSNEGLRQARVNSDPYSLVELRRTPFTQMVPPKEDLLVQHAASMMLPPHLLLNLPHLAGDGDKPPVHVQLNHVFLHGTVGSLGNGAQRAPAGACAVAAGAASARAGAVVAQSGNGGQPFPPVDRAGAATAVVVFSMCTRFREAVRCPFARERSRVRPPIPSARRARARMTPARPPSPAPTPLPPARAPALAHARATAPRASVVRHVGAVQAEDLSLIHI